MMLCVTKGNKGHCQTNKIFYSGCYQSAKGHETKFLSISFENIPERENSFIRS